MDKAKTKKRSRFLSLVLRHQPGLIGLTLDPHGWAQITELLEALRRNGKALSEQSLRELVRDNDKRRFVISRDGQRIRAAQGHSIPVELELLEAKPPQHLYHGTVKRFLKSISQEGLRSQERHHVHLSPDRATARKVGGRRGKPFILQVQSQAMSAAGHKFYLSENGVWLANSVPTDYLLLIEEDGRSTLPLKEWTS